MEWGGLRFEVLKAGERRIQRVLCTRLPDAADAGTDPSAEDRPVARDVLEEDLIDEREARRVRESEDFTGDFDQDQEELR